MYMAPITRADADAARTPAPVPVRAAARSAVSPLKRRLVGVPVLLVSVAVMAPWLAVNAAVSAAVLGAVALGRGPRALVQAIDYAGEVILGG